MHLRQHILGPHHRTGQKRREKGQIKRVCQKIATRLNLTTVDVNYIAYRPEREKRYARRKYYIQRVEFFVGNSATVCASRLKYLK